MAEGLRLWDDPTSAQVAYINDFPKTWCQLYQVGGLNPKLNWEVAPDVKIKADWDGATCKYNDDLSNDARFYQDWASIFRGTVASHGLEVTGKVLQHRPELLQPGIANPPLHPRCGIVRGGADGLCNVGNLPRHG
jgi:hypothetical protein